MAARRGRFADRGYYRQVRLTTESLALAQRLRNSKRWKVLRRAFLNENPLCAECTRRGELRAAVEVDHVRRLEAHPELAYEWGNLQGLCEPCHAAKSAAERVEAAGGPPVRPPPTASHPKARRPPADPEPGEGDAGS